MFILPATHSKSLWSLGVNKAHLRLLLVVLFQCLYSMVFSLPASGDKTDSPINIPSPDDVNKIAVDGIVLGVILIVTGILFTFWGGKLFKLCLFLAGAYLFALIAITILQNMEHQSVFNNRKAVYWGVTLAAAIIGGFLFSFFYKLGIFAVGCFGGYCFALYVVIVVSLVK
jgi:hypothetical protein